MPGARLAALLLVAALVLVACGDDPARRARVDEPRRPRSVATQVGTVRLLHVRIQAPGPEAHPTAGNAALFLTLANSAPAADTLVAVSSVDAGRVVQRVGGGPVHERVRITVPSAGTRSLQDPGGLHLELAGLKRDIESGQFVPVTFRFAEAGAVTLKVFVQVVDHAVVPAPG